MTSIRLSTRTEISKNIAKIYAFVNDNDAGRALLTLDALEMNITVYFNTRGLACDQFEPIFAETRNLLHRPFNRPKYKRQLFGCMLKINKELGTAMPAGGGNERDGGRGLSQVLRYISDNLLDAYSEFNLSGGQDVVQKNRELLDLIKNDLMEMRELEPLFGDRTEEFNNLLKAINPCLMIIPQAKDVSINVAVAKVFRQVFQDFFDAISNILVPVTPKPEEEPVKKTEAEGEKVKPLSELGKELDMDLDNMEKKARESFSGGSSDEEVMGNPV